MPRQVWLTSSAATKRPVPRPPPAIRFQRVVSSAARTYAASGPAAGGGATAGAPAARPAGPRSGRDLLAALAEGLRPSGSFTLRGEPILTFGARRVKVGDALTVTFEGAEYAVVISAIKPPNFTFRLNNEEFTRPIK